MSLLNGIPVIVTDYLFGAAIKEVRQRRKHWRSKVNKKWRKRYGVETIYEPCGYQFQNKYVVNREMFNALQDKFGVPKSRSSHVRI